MATEGRSSNRQLSELVDIELYPDLVRMGGLASAVFSVAAKRRVRLGEVRDVPGMEHPAAIVISSGESSVSILLGVHKRWFSIKVFRGSNVWASGGTDELLPAVMAANAWLDGVTLAELANRFQFMSYSLLAEAYEKGNPVEVQWSLLLEDEAYVEIRPLLQAVYAIESLRDLFPVVSHNTQLRLYVDVDSRSSRQFWVTIQGDGMYRVEVGAEVGIGEVVGSLAAAVETLISYVRLS
ncbi:DUF6193 family natural product biosynthesis protein [Actinomadura luteofluorescens]|uniref:DUF6193 family natural product biosynthesis protein n=1 Tax=Actinomadura luteofluorescens TaxID=46163 RepID=UPI003D8A26BF